ncbi:MAG: 50S ribosomal protein L19e [Ignisphaera sp.]
MDLSYQRRLAAEILGVGESRIAFNMEQIDKVVNATTKDDIRRLIKDGIIYIELPRRNSRGRWKIFHEARKEGRHRGAGRRKGKAGARTDHKYKWVYRIRKIRAFLKWLRNNNIIDRRTYRILYRKAKGGTFDSLSSLKRYMKDHGLLPQNFK